MVGVRLEVLIIILFLEDYLVVVLVLDDLGEIILRMIILVCLEGLQIILDRMVGCAIPGGYIKNISQYQGEYQL